MRTERQSLANLILRLKTGQHIFRDDLRGTGIDVPGLTKAVGGGLEAVARLEIPLLARRWTFRIVSPKAPERLWTAEGWAPGFDPEIVEPDFGARDKLEAHARLIVVLSALCSEAPK